MVIIFLCYMQYYKKEYQLISYSLNRKWGKNMSFYSKQAVNLHGVVIITIKKVKSGFEIKYRILNLWVPSKGITAKNMKFILTRSILNAVPVPILMHRVQDGAVNTKWHFSLLLFRMKPKSIMLVYWLKRKKRNDTM